MRFANVKMKVLVFCCTILGLTMCAECQIRPTQITNAEKQLRSFYDSYADDLRQHRREAIADRYDRRGVYMMGNGNKNLSTFEQIRARYIEKWKGPKSFEWKDLSFEVLSPTVAVVLGKFEWQTDEGKVFKYSYTGVLIKRDGRWRIRVEDESSQ